MLVTLREWIERLVADRYKTTAALAKAIGMTESGFSRASKASTFDVENCLRLAQETGESAATVLKLAGKGHVNDLIETLYGKARAATDPDAAKAATMMGQIEDSEARQGFLQMIRGYLKAQAAATPTTHAPRRR